VGSVICLKPQTNSNTFAGSLRGRLLKGLLPPAVFILLASALVPFFLIMRPAEDAFDRALGDGAYAIETMIRSTPSDKIEIDKQAEKAIRADSVDSIYFALVGPLGKLIAGDAFLLSKQRPVDAPNPWVYDDAHAGEKIRVFVLRDACGNDQCEIRVAETLRARHALIQNALLAGVLPQLVLGSFALLFVFIAVKRALIPFQTFASRLSKLGNNNWEPIDPEEVVEEVRPLVSALNRAASELNSAVDSQQRFLSTAAHQLRTPLAGLKAGADLARLTKNPAQLDAQLEKVSASADRVARLATQLLALARAEPQLQHPEESRACDLRTLTSDLMDDYLRLAGDKKIDLGFELSSAPLVGHPLLLRELMANLLDNAIRYTPAGGSVTLRTGLSYGPVDAAWLEVEDNGPGISIELRELATVRFARLPGVSEAGSGLGLAIVKEIVEAHEALMTMSDAFDHQEGRPGLIVRVEFPKPT